MNIWKRLKNGWKLLIIVLLATAVGLIASEIYNLNKPVKIIQQTEQKQIAEKQGAELMNNMINNKEVFQKTMNLAE